MLDGKPRRSSIISLALVATAFLTVAALAVDALAEYGPGGTINAAHGLAGGAGGITLPRQAGDQSSERNAIIIRAVCITEASMRTCYAQ